MMGGADLNLTRGLACSYNDILGTDIPSIFRLEVASQA